MRFIGVLRSTNPCLGSVAVTVAFLGFALALPEPTGQWSSSALLLMAVLTAASVWGLGFGLLVSVLAALAYDYFFFPPIYSLQIYLWPDALAVVIFAGAAAAVTALAETLNWRTLAARRDEIFTRRLFALSQRLTYADDMLAVANSLVASVGVTVGARAALFLEEDGRLKGIAVHPTASSTFSGAELEAMAAECASKARRIGEAADETGETFTRLPLEPPPGPEAILVVAETTRRAWWSANRVRAIDALATLASAAFNRAVLVKRAEDAQVAAETERLRSALLASISHDLKTPLAVIVGSASSLSELGSRIEGAAAQELLQSILKEGKRLNQFIVNLLDMSRIESDAIRPKRQIADMNDIVGSALRGAAEQLRGHRLIVKAPPAPALAEIDPVLMEKTLLSVLENAAIYTPLGTQVTVEVAESSDSVMIRIIDEGPGISDHDLPHIFEKFFRGHRGTWKPTGTGLGLAISRGLLEVMGGTISAANRTERRGAVFTIEVPKGAKGANGEELLGKV